MAAPAAASDDPSRPVIDRPGPVVDRPAPKLIRELIELGVVVRSGLDIHALGQRLPDEMSLTRDEALAGLARAANPRPAVTWLGHATFVIRTGRTVLLTDPVFAGRLFSDIVGPRRRAPMPINVEDLPHVDAILISHADYDHLDMPSLTRLAERFPQAVVVTPLRNADLVMRAGFTNVRELPIHGETRIGEATVRALPAYHDNRREPGNPFRREWASFSISAGGNRVFFGGDTAYGPAFADIRRRYGRHELALLGISAYVPRPATVDLHANPEEAAQIARDLGASDAIGMHWGTYALSPEPFLEPHERFLAAGGDGVTTRTLKVGETFLLR